MERTSPFIISGANYPRRGVLWGAVGLAVDRREVDRRARAKRMPNDWLQEFESGLKKYPTVRGSADFRPGHSTTEAVASDESIDQMCDVWSPAVPESVCVMGLWDEPGFGPDELTRQLAELPHPFFLECLVMSLSHALIECAHWQASSLADSCAIGVAPSARAHSWQSAGRLCSPAPPAGRG